MNQCFKSKVLIELSSINVIVEAATFKPAATLKIKEKKGDFAYESSLGGSRLMTSPFIRYFCGFPGYKPVGQIGLRFVCWFYDRNTQRLTESGFMEKLGMEPAAPGL